MIRTGSMRSSIGKYEVKDGRMVIEIESRPPYLSTEDFEMIKHLICRRDAGKISPEEYKEKMDKIESQYGFQINDECELLREVTCQKT